MWLTCPVLLGEALPLLASITGSLLSPPAAPWTELGLNPSLIRALSTESLLGPRQWEHKHEEGGNSSALPQNDTREQMTTGHG